MVINIHRCAITLTVCMLATAVNNFIALILSTLNNESTSGTRITDSCTGSVLSDVGTARSTQFSSIQQLVIQVIGALLGATSMASVLLLFVPAVKRISTQSSRGTYRKKKSKKKRSAQSTSVVPGPNFKDSSFDIALSSSKMASQDKSKTRAPPII